MPMWRFGPDEEPRSNMAQDVKRLRNNPVQGGPDRVGGPDRELALFAFAAGLRQTRGLCVVFGGIFTGTDRPGLKPQGYRAAPVETG